jgi:hypothetical protein
MSLGLHGEDYQIYYFGGESLDPLVDGGKVLGTYSGWSIVTSPVKTGVGAWKCVCDGTQGGGLPTQILWLAHDTPSAALIAGMMGWFYLSGNPSAAFCLIGPDATAYYPDMAMALEVGTDRKVRLVLLHNGATTWTARTPLSDWSTDALASGGWTHLAWYWDAITLGTSHVWSALQIDEVNQWAVDAGARDRVLTYFLCPAYSNAGIDVYMDDLAGFRGTAAADAPHLTHFPKAQVHRQLAIGNSATYNEWTGVGDLTDKWKNWDDAAGNDGDTTYNWTNTTSKRQASTGQSAATVGITGHTVLYQYDDGYIGPALNVVHKCAGAGTKYNGAGLNSLGTVINELSGPGAVAYEGAMARMRRTAGTNWTVADLANLEFGCQTPAADHNKEWRVSLCMVQWPTYASTLPLTTTPNLARSQTCLI